jgi:hypothetical protein
MKLAPVVVVSILRIDMTDGAFERDDGPIPKALGGTLVIPPPPLREVNSGVDNTLCARRVALMTLCT